MRVAVVGAGVYGCVIAVDLARAGHRVDLYERHQGLLHGASRANQARLHGGYHYPRSPETAKACAADARRFAARFGEAVWRGARHVYAVSADGSRTDAAEYRRFCDGIGQGHRAVREPLLQGVGVAMVVPEAFIDIPALRRRLRGDLRAAGVTVHLGVDVEATSLPHDLVVMATYGRGFPLPLRYEVCEVALVRLGVHYAGRSIVVMDGGFCGLDPMPGSDVHLLYHVELSVHAANVGLAPEVPGRLVGLLDRGPVWTPQSRADRMLVAARRWFVRVGMPEPCGSLFTVRAVLPDVDATDERPTIVHHDTRDGRDGRVVWVLAGKLDGAVDAADRLVELAA